ncbi:hypothetical protein ABMA32_08000 [Mesorhizobium sp. VNQ89]|uniref:hypothetical protein n=1 Tax=Mesorhizobium quangtriensis TaxID=3157709 RepID=UPI0032B7589C
MADFVAVLKKTLDGMGETTPAARQRVYEKARQTVAAKLAAINPPPPPSVADRQRRALEDAIKSIEKEYAASSDPLSELEDVFASLKNPQPKVLDRPAAPVTARPAAPPPRPAAQAPRPAMPAARQTEVPPPPPRQPAPSPRQAAPQLQPTPQAARRTPAPPPETLGLDVDDAPQQYARRQAEPARKRGFGPLLMAAVLLAVIAGGGYGVWLNRDAFGSLLGLGDGTTTTDASGTDAPAVADTDTTPPPVETTETPKYTQRLTPEGTETDPGPANGGATVGEGTSVAGLTQPPGINPPMSTTDPASPAAQEPIPGAGTTAPAADSPLAVAQKAIFYEERTSASEGSAEPGQTVWSLVQESPGNGLPPEPAIRAEATIPGKDVRLRMTIKRNADQSLPASHIIEMIFLMPDNFPGGGVENILRVAMKGSEQEAGNPLIGIPAKIADGFFLVALNDSKAEEDANLTLLRRQSWIDIPVVYKTGRRALFTMEKGVPGDQVFDEALKAWSAAAGAEGATTTAPG